MLARSAPSSSHGFRLLPSLVRRASTVARPPSLAALNTQDDMKLARSWISAFEKVSAEDWPKNLTDVSFTRSSGPGGQHVNRTFSKAVTNLADCLSKLKAAILEAAKRDLVGETSEAQKEKVQLLIDREKVKMVKAKKLRKETKSGRGKVRGWD